MSEQIEGNGNRQCGKCGLPIRKYETGLRYFGTYIAHNEERCLELLQAELSRLRTELEARGWIPVEERLPKPMEYVLVYQGDAGTQYTTAWRDPVGRWIWADLSYKHPCNPSYWQPKPPPPADTGLEGKRG